MTYTKEEYEKLADRIERSGTAPNDPKTWLAIASALRIASRASWHRIDDPVNPAPKDGTWILLYSPEGKENEQPPVAACCWGRLSYNWEPQWVWGNNDAEHSFRGGFYGSTHWMPLPPPPDEGG